MGTPPKTRPIQPLSTGSWRRNLHAKTKRGTEKKKKSKWVCFFLKEFWNAISQYQWNRSAYQGNMRAKGSLKSAAWRKQFNYSFYKKAVKTYLKLLWSSCRGWVLEFECGENWYIVLPCRNQKHSYFNLFCVFNNYMSTLVIPKSLGPQTKSFLKNKPTQNWTSSFLNTCQFHV